MRQFLQAAHAWQSSAQAEQARILAALGAITTGGRVENIQHIGATSVAGLPAQPCIDLALAVNPFPLDAAALAALDYQVTSDSPMDSPVYEQRALHTSGRFQLWISEPGSDEWDNHLLLRDFLRHDEDARWRYAAAKPAQDDCADERADERGYDPVTAAQKATFFAELLAAAHQWWPGFVGFGPVQSVAAELADYGGAWYLSSGWAIDLHLGRVTRVHHDVDVVVPRPDQLRLRAHLEGRGWQLVTPLHGRLEVWLPHTRLELPRHQLHAHREGQFIDFLLTDFTGDVWHYRRDPRIVRNLAQATQQSATGIPYLAPEVVLLFKSKNTGARARVKDQADYAHILSHLGDEARAWLRWALIATDPAHPWLADLT